MTDEIPQEWEVAVNEACAIIENRCGTVRGIGPAMREALTAVLPLIRSADEKRTSWRCACDLNHGPDEDRCPWGDPKLHTTGNLAPWMRVHISDNVTFVATQLENVNVSEYRTKIILKPENLVPDVDLVTGEQG